MATHDYNIANQIGSEFRADLNNALLAIVSNNSNATSPSTTYAYQLWVDTANNVLKLRNSANNAWITTGISITASNSFTGDITGNSATATALATARTINGVSFDGTANISFNTDSVSEGSSNLYFTNERVDDQVNSLLTAGSGISLTYDDAAGTLTIANTNSADITSVVAGDGLTGGGTSGDVTLAVGVDDSSIEINSDTLRVKASGVTNAMLAGSIANDKLAGSIANAKLANSSVTINSQAISLGGSHTFDSDDIGEGSSNLYFTNARARGSLSIGSEGSASGNGAIAYNSSTGVFTYTPPVISGLTGDTDDLSEGSSNLYYTDARANSAIDARVTNTFINNLSGVVADTSTALATARSIALSGDVTASGVNFDGTGDITLSTTIAANSVALGTDTTGNYVATIADAGNSRITVANSGSETAAVTLDIADDAIGTDQLANNAVALGTQSTGNYVATVAGTSNEIEVSGSGSETASITIGLPDDVTIAGNLTVNGTTTTVNSDTLSVTDPLIKLAKANSGADSLDIGFYGLYDTSGSQDLYAGLFRDASDSGKFKLFKDLQAEPTTTVNTSGTGYAVGTLVSNLEGDVTGNVTGNVSGTAATVTGAAQTNITSLGTLTALTVTGEITANGGIALGDSDKATFGDSDDLQIFHTGSSSVIADAGTGDLKIRANDLIIQSYSLEHNYIQADEGGEVRLYHNNSEKLNTSSSGVTVAGTLTATTLAGTLSTAAQTNITSLGTLTGLTTTGDINLGDNDKVIFGAGSDLQIYHNANNSFIEDAGTGDLYVRGANSVRIQSYSDNEDMIKADKDGAVTLYHNNSAKLATTSSGVDVTGNIANTSGDMTIDVAGDIILDADGGDIRFRDGGTEVGTIVMDDGSNTFIFKSAQSDADIKFNGNDGGSGITALTLDMSDAGAATFNSNITFGDGHSIGDDADDNLLIAGSANENIIIDSADDIILDADGGDVTFKDGGTAFIQIRNQNPHVAFQSNISNGDIKFIGSDAGSDVTALTLDMSDAGKATFNSGATFGSAITATQSSAATAATFKVGDNAAQVANVVVSNDADTGLNLGVFGSSAGTAGMISASDAFITTSTTELNVGVNNSSGVLKFGVGNGSGTASERMRIASNGSIGINMTSPSSTYVLDVSGSIRSSGNSPSFNLREDDSSNQHWQLGSYGGVFAVRDVTASSFPLQITGNKVGINEGSPDKQLHIKDSGTVGIVIESTDNAQNLDIDFYNNSGSAAGRIRYAEGSGALSFMPNQSTESVVFRYDGKVGIGTESPQAHLDINTETAEATNVILNGEANQDKILKFRHYGNSEAAGDGFAGFIGSVVDNVLTLGHYNSSNTEVQALHINESGNVGIGTSSPERNLSVNSGSSSGYIQLVNTNSGTGSSDGLQIKLDSAGAEADIINRENGRLAFHTNNAERMRIDSSGNLLLGTTSNQGVGGISFEKGGSGFTTHNNNDGASGGYEFYVFRRSSTQIGSIAQSSTNAVQYNTSSDARLKDITGSSRGLDVINNLNPVAYNWKSDNHADEGLIAQEVEELVPNAVSQSEDGYYQMDYSKLVTHLVKGMQEQQEQIESLKSEIAKLKGE